MSRPGRSIVALITAALLMQPPAPPVFGAVPVADGPITVGAKIDPGRAAIAADGGDAVDQGEFRWTSSALMANGLPIIGYNSRDHRPTSDGLLHPRVARYVEQTAIAEPVSLDSPLVTYDNESPVDLAADGSGLILAMFLDANPPNGVNQGHFVVRRSTDLGVTWSAPAIPAPLSGLTAGWGSQLVSQHQLYFDAADGLFYFFWGDLGTPWKYITSADGVTWSAVTSTIGPASGNPGRSRVLQFFRTHAGTWITYGNMGDGGTGWEFAHMVVWRLDNGLAVWPTSAACNLFSAREADAIPITQYQRSVSHTPGAIFYLPQSATPERVHLLFGATSYTGFNSNAHGHLFHWWSDDDGVGWQNENGPVIDPSNCPNSGDLTSLDGPADVETPDPEPATGPLADISAQWVPSFGQLVVWGVEGNNNNDAPGLDFSIFANGSRDQVRIQGVGGYPTSGGDFGQSAPYAFGRPQAAAFSPDPVNLATGSFTSQADDLVMPGRVIGLLFSRWYNSADDRTGPLGPGWTHSYNWTLTDAGATVEVRRGDGRRDTFTRNGDGTYAHPPDTFNVLAKNGDGTFTLMLTSQVQYEFTSAGVLTRIHEPAGNQLSFAYTAGNLTTITDSSGRPVSLGYDGSNRLTQIQDPLGRKVTYAYDASGRLATVTDKIGNAPGQDPALHRWSYAYDGATRHITTITDPDGRVRVTNTYDGQGRVYQQRDGLNKLTQMAYASGQTTLTDARGHATLYRFDSRMRVLSQSDTLGTNTYVISYVYDADGNRTAVTDRNGKTTDFSYDARGNLLTKTDPEIDPQTPRYLTQFAYDARNNLTQVTDPLNFVTTTTYDPATNVLLSVSRQIGATTYATTKYEYADATNPGLPTKVISPRGNTGPTPNYTFATSLSYDAQGNLVTRIDPDGAKTTFAYDDVGRLTSFVDPDGYATGANPAEHTWTIGYDENDRETSRTDPLSNLLRYGYDGAGDRTSVTDRRGNVTSYGYDANTRLATTRQQPDPAGQPTLYYTTAVTRDDNGNATRITQANGVVTDYGFDALNRLTAVTTHPDAQTNLTTSYALDGNGQPLTRTAGDGSVVSYGYDALSRLVSVAAAGLATITYGYDAASRRTQMLDGTGTTTYQYDGLGRATQIAGPNGTLTYTHDLDGNRTTLGYPGSQNVTYAYSPGGRMSTVTDWASRISTYTYRDSGLVATLQYPNSMLATYAYDRAQRLTQITNATGATTITQHTYTLDAEGNRTALDEYVQGITPPVVSWAASVQVNDVATGQQDRPAIAIGADGATYLIWDDYRSVSNGDIYFSRRDPATGAWSANQKVNNDTGTRTQWEPAIALDGTNNAYAVWSDQRDGNKTPDTNIYASKRSASTGTWSANVRVNNDTQGSASQGSPSIAARSTGDAIAAWEDHRSNQWNIYSARLPAGGSTWATNLRVTDNTSSRKYTPEIAFGPDGTAYAVWEDDRSGNSDIWFSSLAWGSSTWTANVKISDDPGAAAQYDPHIGVDAAGDLIVTWIDDRVASSQVRMRRRPAGQSWETSVVASDAAAIPVVTSLGVADNGDSFAVWQDARGASYDIWGAEYTFASNTWSTSAMLSDDPGATAQLRPSVARTASEGSAAWRDDRLTGGDIRARRRTTANGVDHLTYAYDAVGRMTSSTGPTSETFTFDAGWNVIARTGPSMANTFDGANRQTSDGLQAFVWDGADRLASRGADTFTFDALSRMTSTTVNGTMRSYGYDGNSFLVGRLEGSLLWDMSVSPAPLLKSGTDRVIHGLGPLYLIRSDDTTVSLARDGLGSVRVETNSATAVLRSFRFAAYGTVAASQGGAPTLLGFAGEPMDPTGLTYLRARWYDPSAGRFMSRDPVRGGAMLPASLNGYAYAYGAPLMRTDPSGLWVAGICDNFSAGLFQFYGSVQGCITIDQDGEIGATFTVARGLTSSAELGGGPGLIFSPEATSVCDLGGPFYTAGVSARLGVGLSIDVSTGSGCRGQSVTVYSASLSFGADLPFAAAHGGLSWTETADSGFNLFEAIRQLRSPGIVPWWQQVMAATRTSSAWQPPAMVGK